ncbi:Transposon Ty3-I Gag-Pol polyprotein [Wickerhamomyces ciferrii]|uniref:Transposon Ty3-I Gag-Pol polyprotein n=1 Tax=Wickerhamomyces ciferrii (strain ATCC 14091 / BCRC 22168 / CBS 111 / JCM 3599 / NBRC 0793 / NRRL Y-1031 F-60-10) TaxID=1206466 RepID=K0KY59_WICCF|nr:Transposon Ty3-I Gag-Pol polyprotein [Wickerhamomyces ciferrii]CCH47012.1 Transposon Ty3-I Gag-Pol polyprotein [Wickerhamomyces ciferrii]
MEQIIAQLSQALAENQIQNQRELNQMVQEMTAQMVRSVEMVNTHAQSVNSGQNLVASTVKIPTFYGKRDSTTVMSFLSSLNLSFDISRVTSDSKKIMLLGAKLIGEAQIWFNNLVGNDYENWSFDAVIKEFKGRFLPMNSQLEARKKIKNIRQEGSAEKYIRYFNSLVALLPDTFNNEEILLEFFLDGLKDDIEFELRAKNVMDLNEAFKLALTFDDIKLKGKRNHLRNYEPSKYNNYDSPNTYNRFNNAGHNDHPADRMDLDALDVKPKSLEKESSSKRNNEVYKEERLFKLENNSEKESESELEKSELEDSDQEGFSSYYTESEPESVSDQQLSEESEESETEECLSIKYISTKETIQSKEGLLEVDNADAIELKAQVLGSKTILKALIDTGATSCFIGEGLVKDIKFEDRIKDTKDVTIRLAAGNKTVTANKGVQLPLRIDFGKIKLDLTVQAYVVPKLRKEFYLGINFVKKFARYIDWGKPEEVSEPEWEQEALFSIRTNPTESPKDVKKLEIKEKSSKEHHKVKRRPHTITSPVMLSVSETKQHKLQLKNSAEVNQDRLKVINDKTTNDQVSKNKDPDKTPFLLKRKLSMDDNTSFNHQRVDKLPNSVDFDATKDDKQVVLRDSHAPDADKQIVLHKSSNDKRLCLESAGIEEENVIKSQNSKGYNARLVQIYADDVILYIPRSQNHSVNVPEVLGALQNKQIIDKEDENNSFNRELEFLGGVINKRGFNPPSDDNPRSPEVKPQANFAIIVPRLSESFFVNINPGENGYPTSKFTIKPVVITENPSNNTNINAVNAEFDSNKSLVHIRTETMVPNLSIINQLLLYRLIRSSDPMSQLNKDRHRDVSFKVGGNILAINSNVLNSTNYLKLVPVLQGPYSLVRLF